MKVFSLFGLTCTIFSCVLHGAPSDSLTERSVIRLLPGYSIGTRSPFSLAPQESFAGTSGLFRFDRTTDFHASVDQPDQNESLVESPFYFRPAFLVGGALATTAVLIRTDQQTYNTLHSWRMANDPLEDVSPVITNLGDGRASMAIFGGFLAYSYVARDRSAFQAGKIGLESFLVRRGEGCRSFVASLGAVAIDKLLVADTFGHLG